jgi:hypothetical protein
LKKFTVLVISLLFLSVARASADLRTIIVDGDVSDWGGVAPLLTDPQNDQTGCPEEDIKAVYVANDAEHLYFRMELYNDVPEGVEIFGDTNFDGEEYAYIFLIDSIPGSGDPDYGGADYAIEYSVTGLVNVIVINVTASSEFMLSNTYLLKYNETLSDWQPVFDCPYVEGSANATNIEVSVGWNCIGGADCFYALFMAKCGIPNTDYAPDLRQGEPITVQVCPCFPVAGELVDTRSWIPYTRYLIAVLAISSLYMINNQRGKQGKQFP